jgi:gliding motility-associated-like protein
MKKILILLALIFSGYFSFSTHYMGGEITWICIKGGPDIGKYIFQMKIYRDCDGSSIGQSSVTLDHHNYPAVGGMSPILLNFIQNTDISPSGAGIAISGNNCYDCASGNFGAVEEFVWQSDPISLAGAPPAQGWHFTYTNFARNDAVVNIANPGSLGMTLRAAMYPYNDPLTGLVTPADPCFDSSPEFEEEAKTIITSGYPFSYSHNASDEELDVLTYSWAEPLDNYGLTFDPANPLADAIPYLAPYTITEPIPGNPTLDTETGQIEYFSNISGSFVTCVKVEAKKCGQLVAEIFREVQVLLIPWNDPAITQPTDGFNDPPTISAPFPGTPTPFETIVYAGDLVTFNITAEDLDTYTGGVAQNVTVEIAGGQFAFDPLTQQFSLNNTLCDNPPCATFENGNGVVPPFNAPSIANGVFEWQTHCNHINRELGCENTSSIFNFSITAYDDFCPANAIKIATIKITVVPPIPDFRCVSVEDNGDVELSWVYPANALPTNEPIFIWHSINQAGPYTLIDSTFFPTDNYTHIGPNGDDAIQYYFLSNEEGCDTTGLGLYSDTLQSILLNITPINLGISASFDWNAIHMPLLTTSELDYDMYIKYDTSILFYNYLTTPLLSVPYDANRCEDNFQLYVEIADGSGCISRSSLEVTNLGDTMSPITPIITDVSVDSNGKATISWTSSADTYDYEIYQYGAQGWETIGTVLAPNNTFLYTLSNANSYSEIFSVRALDTCDNTRNKSLEHNSIYLTSILDACSGNLTLSWNDYINWVNSVSSYDIVVEQTDLDGVVTVTQTNVLSNSDYVVSGLRDKYLYKIYIIANDGNLMFSATSNLILLNPDLPKKPEYNYIEYATINHSDESVDISCIVDVSAVVERYDIYRSLRQVDSFAKIGEISFSGSTPINYSDKNVSINDQFYQYEVFPVDTCGVTLYPPPFNLPVFINDTSFAQTILLESEANIDYSEISSLANEYTNTLVFNEYNEWLGDVIEYRLYRSINSEPFNMLPIKIWNRSSNPNEELRYIDPVSNFGNGNGRFCYYIEAIEGVITPHGPSSGSLSNITCVNQTPIIFVPNTFTPNGDDHNELFKPITYFVSEDGYLFSIYSRSGQRIFETNDPQKGWDGSYEGSQVQNGNYVYHLQFLNSAGNLTEKTDVITLVR